MREVSSMCTKLSVYEDDQYKLVLCRMVDAPEVIHLYGVRLYLPFKIETVYVLANNEEDAISQAMCKISMPFADRKDVASVVEQLPLMIRGWSNTIF